VGLLEDMFGLGSVLGVIGVGPMQGFGNTPEPMRGVGGQMGAGSVAQSNYNASRSASFGARRLYCSSDRALCTDEGPVSVTPSERGFQIGCTFVTWEAWNELKRRVERAIEASPRQTVPEPQIKLVCPHGVPRGEPCYLCPQ
jgi:hypothetical protein